MSTHLIVDTGGHDAAVPTAADETLRDLVRIVRGARAWCADVLPCRSPDTEALATHLRSAAAALVPLTAGASGVRAVVVADALQQCGRSLELARLALDDLHRATPVPERGRHRRRTAPRAAERAVAFAVLRVAITRARALTDAATGLLDGAAERRSGGPCATHRCRAR